MKIRRGFVTNSSSSCYIIVAPRLLTVTHPLLQVEEIKVATTEEARQCIKKRREKCEKSLDAFLERGDGWDSYHPKRMREELKHLEQADNIIDTSQQEGMVLLLADNWDHHSQSWTAFEHGLFQREDLYREIKRIAHIIDLDEGK